MFIINGFYIKNSYVCGRIKANYLKKHYGIEPFYFNRGLYFFCLKDKDIEFPWYIKIMK